MVPQRGRRPGACGRAGARAASAGGEGVGWVCIPRPSGHALAQGPRTHPPHPPTAPTCTAGDTACLGGGHCSTWWCVGVGVCGGGGREGARREGCRGGRAPLLPHPRELRRPRPKPTSAPPAAAARFLPRVGCAPPSPSQAQPGEQPWAPAQPPRTHSPPAWGVRVGVGEGGGAWVRAGRRAAPARARACCAWQAGGAEALAPALVPRNHLLRNQHHPARPLTAR